MSGTRKTVNSHRPSSPQVIQGRSDLPGTVANLVAVGADVEVVTLWFRCGPGEVGNRVGVWGKKQIGCPDQGNQTSRFSTFIYGSAEKPDFSQ